MSFAAKTCTLLTMSVFAVVLSSTAAYGAIGDQDNKPPSSTRSGGASGNTLRAKATATQIKVTQLSGSTSGTSPKVLAPVDPNWKPPACWYEPVATPQALKAAVDRLKKNPNSDLVPVTPMLSWGEDLMVGHYEKGKAESGSGDGYENYNLGKDGMFWRGVINADSANDPASYDCEDTLFWQNARTLPANKHAPTPDVLAAYAYDKIKVPETEVELKPAAKSTVNVPTWVWLDKGTFKEVKVRASGSLGRNNGEACRPPSEPGHGRRRDLPRLGRLLDQRRRLHRHPIHQGRHRPDPAVRHHLSAGHGRESVPAERVHHLADLLAGQRRRTRGLA